MQYKLTVYFESDDPMHGEELMQAAKSAIEAKDGSTFVHAGWGQYNAPKPIDDSDYLPPEDVIVNHFVNEGLTPEDLSYDTIAIEAVKALHDRRTGTL